jgi:hypothetical protein
VAARRPKRPKGLSEAQRAFRVEVTPADVLAAYGHACAFTGRNLSAEARADPRGVVLVLGGDPLTTDPTLLIPACLDALYAFEQRHLALGPHYNFLIDLETISPEFLESLNPIGRLRLPSDPVFRPSPAALARQRAAFTA